MGTTICMDWNVKSCIPIRPVCQCFHDRKIIRSLVALYSCFDRLCSQAERKTRKRQRHCRIHFRVILICKDKLVQSIVWTWYWGCRGYCTLPRSQNHFPPCLHTPDVGFSVTPHSILHQALATPLVVAKYFNSHSPLWAHGKLFLQW